VSGLGLHDELGAGDMASCRRISQGASAGPDLWGINSVVHESYSIFLFLLQC
jgi:hypothetical protein